MILSARTQLNSMLQLDNDPRHTSSEGAYIYFAILVQNRNFSKFNLINLGYIFKNAAFISL